MSELSRTDRNTSLLLRCWNGCDEGYFDDYEEDPIECEPGEISICRECKGKGGWRVCGTPTIQTPNGDPSALHRREEK